MKERPIIFSTESVRAILDGRKTQTRRVVPLDWRNDAPYVVVNDFGDYKPLKDVCKFGKPGDRLWVREKWRKFDANFDCQCLEQCSCARYPYRYAADYPADEEWGIWKSPLFMPRKFSRLTLEITDVRCERLQDISWNDCIQEGTFQFHGYIDEHGIRSEGKRLFSEMWNTINAKRGFGWDTNCWVWAISFKKI